MSQYSWLSRQISFAELAVRSFSIVGRAARIRSCPGSRPGGVQVSEAAPLERCAGFVSPVDPCPVTRGGTNQLASFVPFLLLGQFRLLQCDGTSSSRPLAPGPLYLNRTKTTADPHAAQTRMDRMIID